MKNRKGILYISDSQPGVRVPLGVREKVAGGTRIIHDWTKYLLASNATTHLNSQWTEISTQVGTVNFNLKKGILPRTKKLSRNRSFLFFLLLGVQFCQNL